MITTPLRIGVDLVDVVRLQGMIDDCGPEFLASAWTPTELRDCDGDAQRLAARWAAKEATMKALDAAIGTVSPLDIEVHSSLTGAPSLTIHRAALARAEELKIGHWSLALSHEAGLAVAFVVALAGGTNNV